ncbi:hypothetical protein DEFR109230_00235 [Deinococcus frigens]
MTLTFKASDVTDGGMHTFDGRSETGLICARA